MLMNRRIFDIARERVLDADERTPTYRADLVRTLVQAIQAQDQEVSERGRRDKISKMVEALAGQVRAKQRES